MTKKIVVTGVTGQDGSYMVDYLLKETPHEIWGMIRRTSKPDLGNLKEALTNPRFRTIVGDLSDSASIESVVKEVKPDYFINLAAQSFVGSSWQIPEQTFDVGAVAIIRCLEAIRQHVPHCHFYNAGSSEEFGDVLYSPQDMAHPQRARSPYGAAKIAARQIVKVWRESYGLYAVQGLLFNHESERRGEEFVSRKVTLGVARIAKAIKDGKPFEPIELGNLDAKRDWSHAADFVRAIWAMLNQKRFKHEGTIAVDMDADGWTAHAKREEALDKAFVPKEYVLASGETHSVREFVEKAFRVAGIDGVWQKGSKPEDERYMTFTQVDEHEDSTVNEMKPIVRINPAFYRPADVELLLGDSTAARRDLGWSPKVTFDELVTRMVRADLAVVGL